jgi:choline dehydrogenase-like flavoprotein
MATLDNSKEELQPASATSYPARDLYNFTPVPQPGLGNTTQTIFSAAVVGGGSTINGMMLTRGASDNYDNWEKLGNKGWAFNDLLPYFVKSTMFQTPSPTLKEDFNITWNGPMHVSFAPWQWEAAKRQLQGMVEIGCVHQLDGADGHAYGVF